MWTVSHFLLEPWCEDYSCLDQAVEDFKHDFDSILMDSVNTPNLDSLILYLQSTGHLSWFITFPVIQQHFDSGLLCHLIISLWILPIRGLNRIILIFILALVLLLMPLQFLLLIQMSFYWFLWWNNYSLRNVWITKILDILGSAVSNCFGNMAHILAYLFNSASRQCYKVWLPNFPFLTT